MASNIAAVFKKKLHIELEKRSIPEPGKNEVQVRMRSVGVCASDVHIWKMGKLGGDLIVERPYILGHECSGVISKVGEGVTNVKVGDRVAIEPHNICRRCEMCISGRYNHCYNYVFFSKPHDDGALIQYLVHSADFVYKLPDNISLDEGALAEPLSVGLHGCRRARLTVGDKVLICGAGTIGICMLLAARTFGAAAIVMTDLNQSRLDFARRMGATDTFKIEKDVKPREAGKALKDMLGWSPNKAIDCSGAEFSVQLAAEVLKPCSVIVLLGLANVYISIPMMDIIFKEIEVIGSGGYTGTWPTAIELISSGKCNVARLVTHRFPLQDTQKAFEMAHSGTGMKVMIECNPE